MFKLLKSYCNKGENITENGGKGAILYLLHKKTSQRDLTIFMRWYLKYSSSFNTEPKYQIKLRASVLIINLPVQTSLSTTEHTKPQKPKAVLNM